jgi:hypothetical protein
MAITTEHAAIRLKYEWIARTRMAEVDRQFSKRFNSDGRGEDYCAGINRVLDEVYAERARELKAAGQVTLVNGEPVPVE